MKSHTRTVTVQSSPKALYAALSDLQDWPKWDADIVHIDHDGSRPKQGTRFTLKPRGGPKTTLVVEVAQEPTRFVDVALLPLCRMRTSHEFISEDHCTTQVRVTIETFGLLSFVWERVIARKQLAGLEHQIQAMAEYAKKFTGTSH